MVLQKWCNAVKSQPFTTPFDGRASPAYPDATVFEGEKQMRKALLPILLLSAMAFTAFAQTKQTPPEPKIKVGDMAPDFTMRDQNGKDVSLRDFRGKKNVALAFYVFAFTGG